MNFDKILNPVLLAIIGVAALTTILGRKNTPKVVDSLGSAFSNSISAALGKGVSL
jgi:hypothetical protein